MRKIKTMIFSLCVAVIGFVTAGVVSLIPAKAAGSMTVSQAISEFVMEEGAAIRKSTDKQGIRFNAILSEQAYGVLSSANAEFGMLIVPKDYVTEGYDLTVENVFGENAVYQANVRASEVEEGKKAIIQITEPTIEQKGDEYKIYGSLVGVLDANLARGFIGRAYVCVDDVYYLADYADGLAANTTRSMAYVAKLAIDDKDSDSATLQTTYVDPVKDKSFDYTVNKVTIDFDGSVVKETISSSAAQFATAIQQNADTIFGFNGESVDSFVGMENAEFNVMYRATPVSIVVENDATATEIYAAEELASYVSQVTGTAVEVVSQATSAYNNIYVATDTGLGLEADSFKLSKDANGNVHINGVDERGTLYGVYEYEEAYMGIKFLTENYTHVPVTNKQISAVSETKTYTPSFAYRTYMNNGVGFYDDANVKYSSHLRFISQFSNERAQSDLMNKVQYTMPWMAQGWLQASHSILAYAAIGAYQAGVTDILTYTVGDNGLLTYCAFNNSASSSSYKSAFDTSGSMLDVCYSDDTAKAWVKAGLKYAMDNYPEMEYFMLGQADKRTNCSCTDCWMARLKGANKSWLIANFVKEMATYTNSLGYTDKKIVMFAYQDTEVAPKAGRNAALTDMPSNVYVQWAPVDSDRYFALDTTNIEGWKSVLGMTEGRFLVWSYEVDFYSYFTYYPTMQNWVTNFDTYKDLGVDLVMMQSSHNTSGIVDSYLDAYVASKLLWDFKADDATAMQVLVESAKSEFIEYFYGTAAKSYVETYYDNFDALYAEKFTSGGYTDGDWSFTESELNGLLDLLEQAISATDDETYINHLNMLTLTPRYMLAKYCQVADATLANDISSVSAMTAEGTTVAADVNLQGDLSFTKGYASIYNVKYDASGRVIGMTVDIPDVTEWYQQSPRFTAEYMNELHAEGVQYVAIEVSSTASGAHFITMYNGEANYYADNGDQRVVVQDGGELFFSYVDVDGGQGLTKATTLELTISYLTDSQIVAKEIGLTVDSAVTVSKNAETNAYTLSNTNGMFTAYFSAEQVNKWIAAGYDAISMNVSFTPSATLTKTVCMNGENFNTMKNLLTDETGNVVWTLVLAEDTPISIWAQNGDDVSTGAFTITNATLLTHVMGDTEYDENNHWKACTREGCNYVSNLGEHSYGSYEGAIGAIDYGCATCGYVQSRTDVEKPTVDFTANTYGASVYSMYLATDYPTQVSATADALTYGLFEDGSSSGGVKSTNQIVLPKINFAAIKTVTIGVLFNTFSWDQQFGLDTNALTNISDGWVNWASYNGTLTFSLVDGELIMTLSICNKQLTQTITDEDIINGRKSASFFAQSYYTNSTVTLSDFEFGGAVAIPDDGRFAAGYATVTDVEYDANEYITSLTVNIPHNVEWSNNSPVLTQNYLNTLYAAGIRKITFSVASTTTTNNFIVIYNGAADYNAVASTFTIVENAGDLKFSYVNLNNGGYTVETTLTITLSYQIDPQVIADEIGMTLASGVNITKDAEGVYTLSNMNGYQKGASFSAEQVNAWIAEGYSSISMRVSFTANANIDTAVAYSASTGWVTDSTGNVVWTFNLNTDEAIDFWAQKSGAVSSGAFTISEIKLNLSPAAIAKEIGMTLASGVNITKDADGVYTLSNMNGYQGGAAFSAEQVNAWIAKGYISISMRVSFTANSAIDTVVAYSASTGYVTDSTGNAVWTFNLKTDEAIDFWVQKSGQVSSGAFTLSEITLKKQPPYVAGYATVSGETYDANDYITGMTMTIPDATEWSGNAPYFTADYLNALYAAGVESIEFTVTSTTDGYSFITFYNNALDYDPRDGYLVTLLENGGALKISYVNLNTGNTAATTLTIAITYHFSPQAIANEIGLTLRDTNWVSKDAENTYTISNAVGYDASAYFSAEQVNAWLAEGYTSISMNVAFTAGETIDTVVYYTVTSSFVSDSTGSTTWNITLRENEAIYLWAQKDGEGSSGAFTISNVAFA